MDDIRHNIPEKPVRFLDQLRLHMRCAGLSYQTEKTYIHWVRKFIYFHKKQHPKDLGARHVEAYLNHLTVNRHCAVATQKIALNALMYLYRRFFGLALEDLIYTPASAPRRLPVVYSRSEIEAILSQLRGPPRLMVALLYGSGLRSAELLALRIKDVDFGSNNIIVRSGKGDKDRATILPQQLIPELERQIARVQLLHEQDLADGFGEVYLPNALSRKYPDAAKEFAWHLGYEGVHLGGIYLEFSKNTHAMPLTDLQIRNAKPKEKPYILPYL